MILILLLICSVSSFNTISAFQRTPPKIDNSFETRSRLMPCIKALLDENPLQSGSNLSKSSQGTLTVKNEEQVQVFFNVTLKTTTGKKGDPPIYLRFIKVEQLDIRKVLEYAKSGDEIFIEQYTTNGSQKAICAPSSMTVT